MRRFVAIIMCCLIATAACSSTTTVTETTAPATTVPRSTVVPEAAPAAQDEADLPGVPFPPSENLVEWSEITLGNPQEMQAAALAHPLAEILITQAELGLLFGHDWRIEFAEIVEDDVTARACDNGDAVASEDVDTSDTYGINVYYTANNGQSANVLLRQGPRVAAILDVLRTFATCAPASEGSAVQALDALGDPASYAAFTNTETNGPESYYHGIVAAISGDMLVAVSSNAISPEVAESNESAIAEAVALMIGRLPAS